jgi:hypothetical protein
MRVTSLVVAAALVCVPAAAAAETPLQKETSVWQAFKDKKADAFGSVIASSYVGLYDDGVASKAKELESLKNAKIESFKIDNFASRMIDQNDMLMTYVVAVKGMMGKDDISGKYNAASVWHRAGTKWLTVYHTEIKAK